MNDQYCVLCVIGTRPEAIKMAPVIAALRASDWAKCLVVATAQHRDLLDQMLFRLNVSIDYDLNLMVAGQTPSDLISRMLPALDRVLDAEKVNMVLAQGDTATVFAAALGAFHRQIPFGHVEAGLRTHDLGQPFPEEGYRKMVASIARWHFAPTSGAAENLLAEGVAADRIHITGNTGIDTLFQTVGNVPPIYAEGKRLILLTAHRRESFGRPLEAVMQAVRVLADRYSDVEVVYPVHPNPNVQKSASELLTNHPRIQLLPPLDYFAFVDLMRQATLILTDSGGIQEEAPALSRPVLVLRNQTERPEALQAGVAELVGTNCESIVKAACRLLDDPVAYARMSKGGSPYGDGKAALRIVNVLRESLFKTKACEPSH